MSFVELLIGWFKLNLMNTDQEPWILILWPLSIARLRTQDLGWFCKTFYIIWNLQRCSTLEKLFSTMHWSTSKIVALGQIIIAISTYTYFCISVFNIQMSWWQIIDYDWQMWKYTCLEKINLGVWFRHLRIWQFWLVTKCAQRNPKHFEKNSGLIIWSKYDKELYSLFYQHYYWVRRLPPILII